MSTYLTGANVGRKASEVEHGEGEVPHVIGLRPS